MTLIARIEEAKRFLREAPLRAAEVSPAGQPTVEVSPSAHGGVLRRIARERGAGDERCSQFHRFYEAHGYPTAARSELTFTPTPSPVG